MAKTRNRIAPEIKSAHDRVASVYGILRPEGEITGYSYNIWNLRRNVIEVLGEIFADHLHGELILDAGCGNGQIARIILAGTTGSIVGVDFSARMLENAISRIHRAGVSDRFSAIRADLRDLGCFRNHSFHGAILFGVIEHLDDPGKVIGEIFRCLKPDGIFILGVPRRFSLSFFTYLLFGESPNRWGRKKRWYDHFNYVEKLRYYRFYSRKTIRDYLSLIPNNELLGIYPFSRIHMDGFPGKWLNFLGRRGRIGFRILDYMETLGRVLHVIPAGEYWVIKRIPNTQGRVSR